MSSLDRVFSVISAAAERGERCPTNMQLTAAAGFASTSSTCDALSQLQRIGRIRVEPFSGGRRVTIAATGKSTAAPLSLRPHWRAERKEWLKPRR